MNNEQFQIIDGIMNLILQAIEENHVTDDALRKHLWDASTSVLNAFNMSYQEYWIRRAEERGVSVRKVVEAANPDPETTQEQRNKNIVGRGYLANCAGSPITANPFTIMISVEYQLWEQGWKQAAAARRGSDPNPVAIQQERNKTVGNQGYLANCEGYPISENPFSMTTADYQSWNHGWNVAAANRMGITLDKRI